MLKNLFLLIGLNRLGMSEERKEKWCIFLDDGSQIFDDAELLDAEMVQGKLLTIAHSFADFQEPPLTVDTNWADVKTEVKKEEEDEQFSFLQKVTASQLSSGEDTGIFFKFFLYFYDLLVFKFKRHVL